MTLEELEFEDVEGMTFGVNLALGALAVAVGMAALATELIIVAVVLAGIIF